MHECPFMLKVVGGVTATWRVGYVLPHGYPCQYMAIGAKHDKKFTNIKQVYYAILSEICRNRINKPFLDGCEIIILSNKLHYAN